jgi:hypothetical protein
VIDVMRSIQKNEIAPEEPAARETELDSQFED